MGCPTSRELDLAELVLGREKNTFLIPPSPLGTPCSQFFFSFKHNPPPPWEFGTRGEAPISPPWEITLVGGAPSRPPLKVMLVGEHPQPPPDGVMFVGEHPQPPPDGVMFVGAHPSPPRRGRDDLSLSGASNLWRASPENLWGCFFCLSPENTT